MNFGGIDEEYSSLGAADFVIVPIPYDLTASYQSGSRKGPAAIIDASLQLELYDEELGVETYHAGIHTMSSIEPDARGPEQMTDKIYLEIKKIADMDKIPVILGGEHTVTVGAVRAMKERYPQISVLHLDAHADMRDTYQGSLYSHACVGRRIWEICPLVQVGVRSMSGECAEFIKQKGIKVFSPDFRDENADWVKKISEIFEKDVYITVDLDVFDPSIMPATGTPEPGGLYWKDILQLVREVSGKCRVRGFDIVELAPIPGMIASDFTAAKLAYRIMGYIEGRHSTDRVP
ncbi:MAG: agmatinase [Deltaproteobacteria bacterium]|nr:agmatinase [Deltaproteobacteria bacterium]